MAEFVALSSAEESFYRQKFRIQWLKLGDQNTGFFHKVTATRKAYNSIRVLYNSQRQKLENLEDIQKEAIKYYKNLLGSPDTNVRGCSVGELQQILNKGISRQQQEMLNAKVTPAEIRQTLFSLHKDKAPGRDGYNAHIFKEAWSIIGDDFTRAVLSFFQTGNLPKFVNSTAITLVPKIQNPTLMTHFRLISCCNTVYKCIAKILANRLKLCLPELINANQSAFIQGLNISDSILLAQELVKGYRTKRVSSRLTIKIDLKKAFDSVDWNFLLNTMAAMNFPSQFIGWLKTCITTPQYSIAINGGLVGYFPGGEGIRQGDPLSPYLFVIVMGVLSTILNAAAENRKFGYHPASRRVRLTHLYFADHLMVFTNGKKDSIMNLFTIFQEFYHMSGLQLNKKKTEVFYANVDPIVIHNMQQSIGFKLGKLPVRYLGLPLVSGRLTTKDCDSLIQRISHRINSWSSKRLSYAG